MTWKHVPIVAIDTETTGMSVATGDRILAFTAGVLKLGPDGQIANHETHSWLVNPEIPIRPVVSEITGISDKDVADQPTFAKIADEVWNLLDGAVVVAHNRRFDKGFLLEEFRRIDREWPSTIAEIDTIDLSMRTFPDATSHQLDDLCARLAVDPPAGDRRTPSSALASGRCFVEMARRSEIPDDLEKLLEWAKPAKRG